jgi:hypothetical protein
MPSSAAQPGRGWADWISSAVDVGCGPEDLQSYVTEGRLPKSVLPNFLHEFAHYYCLQSPVGGAIVVLHLQARDWLVEWAQKRGRRSPIAPTAVRVDTAVRLLQPLFEGMALFAEHDLVPGESRVASSLSFWAALLFLPLSQMTSPVDTESIDRAIAEMLSNARLATEYDGSRSWAANKASLLLQPLALEHGGYLAGYLAVKNRWRIARQTAPELANPDLFLMYFYSLLFDDYGMVAILLDQNVGEAARARRMLARLKERLNLLQDASLSHRVAEYQAAVESRPEDATGLDGHYASIFCEEALVEEQRERFRRVQTDWARQPRKGSLESLQVGHAFVLAHRSLMRIGVVPAEVEVTAQRRVVVQAGETRFEGPAKVSARPGSGGGFLAAYFDPQRRGRIVLCFRGDEVAWEEFPEGCDDYESRGEVVYAIGNAHAVEKFYAEWDGLLEQRTELAVNVNVWLRERFPHELEAFYEELALQFAPPDRGAACAEALLASGLKAILGRPDLARALALLGLLGASKASYAEAVERFQSHGLDLRACERDLRERARQWGLPLLGDESDFESVVATL